MSKNPREFSFRNLPSDLKSYRTFREAGPWSVRSLLPWMGRSAWKLHIGLIIPPPSLLCSRYQGRHATLLPTSGGWEEHCVTTLIAAAKETTHNQSEKKSQLFSTCSQLVPFHCQSDSTSLTNSKTLTCFVRKTACKSIRASFTQ